MVDLNGRLRLHESFRYELRHAGAEGFPILVVDQFLSEPQALIDYAATHAGFSADVDAYYPGLRAPIPPIYPFAVRAFLGKIIAAAFNLGTAAVSKERAHFSLVTTRPERLHPLQRIPHFDNTDERHLAVLHYLSPVSQGGTSFYRHAASGFEAIRPGSLARYTQLRDAELQSSRAPPPQYILGTTPEYHCIDSIDGQFNRLIVYHGMCLHSADISPDCTFSSDPRNGRLTANTFFYYH